MLWGRFGGGDDVLNWRFGRSGFLLLWNVKDAKVNGRREVRFPGAVVNQKTWMICALTGRCEKRGKIEKKNLQGRQRRAGQVAVFEFQFHFFCQKAHGSSNICEQNPLCQCAENVGEI